MAVRCRVSPINGRQAADYDFEAVPRVGELITVMFEQDVTKFRVEEIEHKPASTHAGAEPNVLLIVDDAQS